MGGVGGGNLGLRDEAMRNYERADAILTRLHEEAPANEEAAIALAELRRTRANTMVHIAEDMDRGLVFARSVQGILDRECADADRCALVRAQGFTAEGQNLHWLERFEEAVAAYDRALAQIATLDAAARRAEDVIRAEALGHRLKGDTLYYLDDVEGSVRELGIASRILSAAIDRGRNDPDIARDLAIVEWSRGGSLDEAGRPEEGVQALNTAYTIMQEQVAADSDDLGSLRLLAIVGGQRALTLSSAGRYRAAAETANASLTIRRRLSRMQPEEAGYFRDVAIMLAALGDIHNRAGDAARACQTYREALAQFDAFDRRWEMSDFDRGDTYAQIRVALQNC
jgi:tetratricopeptide (TPR) repeat protein